ncbi:hypothetical protein AVO42_00955 [Thiomicrospira sp. XS5]|uniref:methyl-accepting chemotaxis protein n=1 Tax=Thiomicrospira sp. XS5 TaxID=1775636 RepID=UPI00074AE3D7|nr:methyl-accepting chemotaxis protein [Thiomicrospira sp. XS5]KUJ74018.1 hypothetical protein AVO42_00955 [Thiomicrospira sp. XS5]
MRITFVGIVFINLLLGALISALYVNNPDLTPWGLVPAALAVGLVSVAIFYQKLLSHQQAFIADLQKDRGASTDLPSGLQNQLRALVEVPSSNQDYEVLLEAFKTGQTDTLAEQGLPEKVVTELNDLTRQNQRADQVMSDVIEAIQSADFGGQLTLAKAENDIQTAQTVVAKMADDLLALHKQGADRETALNRIQEHLKDNPTFLACWSGWEPNAYDGQDTKFQSKDWHDATGRFMPFWGRSGDQMALEPLVGYEVPGLGDFYLQPLQTRQPQIVEPYMYPVGDDEFLITSVVTPIIDNGTVVGVAGIDISLSQHLDALSDNLMPQHQKIVHNSVQAMMTLKSALAEVTRVMFFMANGQFSYRVDQTLPGDLEALKTTVNDSVSALDNAFSDINRCMNAFSQGDLTQQIQNQYNGDLESLKQGINQAMDNLHRILIQTAETADSVVDNMQSLGQDNQNLNARTQQQAASLEETASSMEELTHTIRNTAQESKTAMQLGNQVKSHVAQGSDIANQSQEAMNEISAASQKIADIVQIIDGISFQTNLLALNASVESARAGEHGRGFAVVAGEVRSLALRASQSSNDIKELVEKNLASVNRGQQLSEQSAQSLNEINQTIDELATIVTEISAAADQEMSSVEQVNQAVSQLDQFTQENAALSDQSAQLSATMTGKAQELQKTMNAIKL